MGHEAGGLYYLDFSPTSVTMSTSIISFSFSMQLSPGSSLSTVLKRQVNDLSFVSPFHCETCEPSKHHHVSVPSRVPSWVSTPFELIHSKE
jgi:hypothetical protein